MHSTQDMILRAFLLLVLVMLILNDAYQKHYDQHITQDTDDLHFTVISCQMQESKSHVLLISQDV